ncbi:10911_t:CDS:2, partial [Cetraspora pellucida]
FPGRWVGLTFRCIDWGFEYALIWVLIMGRGWVVNVSDLTVTTKL